MLKSVISPVRNTSGMARWILVTGLFITAVFVVFALFAPWIAPLEFNQQTVDGVKLEKMAPPSGDQAKLDTPAADRVSARGSPPSAGIA